MDIPIRIHDAPAKPVVKFAQGPATFEDLYHARGPAVWEPWISGQSDIYVAGVEGSPHRLRPRPIRALVSYRPGA